MARGPNMWSGTSIWPRVWLLRSLVHAGSRLSIMGGDDHVCAIVILSVAATHHPVDASEK